MKMKNIKYVALWLFLFYGILNAICQGQQQNTILETTPGTISQPATSTASQNTSTAAARTASASNTQAPNKSLNSSNVAVFFIAREAAAVTQFKTKETNVSATEGQVSDAVSVTKEGAAITQTQSSSKTDVTSTGGSTTQKSDKVEYTADSVSRNEFGSALMDTFSSKGILNIYDGGFFKAIELIEADYSTGDNIKADTWKQVLPELKQSEYDIKYIVVGTIDMGMKGVHRASGEPKVEATVNARIYDITSKIPKLLVALKPITQSAIGATQTLAKKKALSDVAQQASQQIVEKLKEKSLL